MPRWLTFQINGTEFKAFLKKFSREMLYGKSNLERRGEKGEVYQTAYLTADGTDIIISDGFGSNYITQDGKIPQNIIKVNEQGEKISIQPSMFKDVIILQNSISLQEYFHYEINHSYILDSDIDIKPLKKACEQLWEERRLFSFPYAYYDTKLRRDAILILKEDTIFVVVGTYQDPILLSQSEIMYLDEIIEQQLEEDLFFEVW